MLMSVIFRGRAEANAFEQSMAELIDWFIEHPDITWRQQLSNATATQHAQLYKY